MNSVPACSSTGFRISALILTLLMCLASAEAQTQGSSNPSGSSRSAGAPSHTVRGKIFMPSGTPPEQRIRVVLELSTGGVAAEIFSDSVGNFEFRLLPSSSYRVIVPGDGRTYETTQEQVDLYGSFSRTFNVQIYLKDKSADPAARPGSQTVSAAGFSQKIPKDAARLYEKGEKKAREGKNEEAVTLLQNALKSFPDYLLALNKLGEQYLVLNRPAEAQAAFEKALVVNARHPLTHVNLGALLYSLKRLPEAVTHLETANRLDESYPMAHLYLGLALMDSTPADFDRAERELLKARLLGGPEMVKVHQHLFNLNVRRRNWDKAVEQLEAYLQEAPNAPDAPAVREKLGQLKKALAQQASQPRKP